MCVSSESSGATEMYRLMLALFEPAYTGCQCYKYQNLVLAQIFIPQPTKLKEGVYIGLKRVHGQIQREGRGGLEPPPTPEKSLVAIGF